MRRSSAECRRVEVKPMCSALCLAALGGPLGPRLASLDSDPSEMMDLMPYLDRQDAGRRLAAALEHLRGRDVVILGLPRGGVPVAACVAAALDAPLDVVLVRKLGLPSEPELAMGAIGEGGARALNDDVIRAAGIGAVDIARVEARERDELLRRAQLYRGDRPMVPIAGRVVVLVDDGIATGATMKAACEVVSHLGADHVVVAAPVAAPDVVRGLRRLADDVVVPEQPTALGGVGAWYRDFRATTDAEVVSALD
jgi:putative phosphoribosyl transferase